MTGLPTIDEVLREPLRIMFLRITEGREADGIVAMADRHRGVLRDARDTVTRGKTVIDHGGRLPIEHVFYDDGHDDHRSIGHGTARPEQQGTRVTTLNMSDANGRNYSFSIEMHEDDPQASFEARTGSDETESVTRAIAMITALERLIDAAVVSAEAGDPAFDGTDDMDDAADLVAGQNPATMPVRYRSATPWSPLRIWRAGGGDLMTRGQKKAWIFPPILSCRLSEESRTVSFGAAGGVTFDDKDAVSLLRVAGRLPKVDKDQSC